MKQWYERLFANYAKTYDKEVFTQGTLQEVGFIENEIKHDRSKTILDIGCGTGRHAIELAKRGYKITGIDLSEAQIKHAKVKAKNEGVEVNFLVKDARKFKLDQKFDLAIIICEGGFSLMETDEMNFQILKQATSHLTEKGKIILTCLSALFPLFHSVKDFLNKNMEQGETGECSFNLMEFREYSSFKINDDDGREIELATNERYFTPPEIKWYFTLLGFNNIDILGCDCGNFDRNSKLTTEHFEMMAIAER